MYGFIVLKKTVKNNNNEYKHRALSYYIFSPTFTNTFVVILANPHLPPHFWNADRAALYLHINTIIIFIVKISVFQDK